MERIRDRAWNMPGSSMEYAGIEHGICRDRAWNMPGSGMEYAGIEHGICRDRAWHMLCSAMFMWFQSCGGDAGASHCSWAVSTPAPARATILLASVSNQWASVTPSVATTSHVGPAAAPLKPARGSDTSGTSGTCRAVDLSY